MVALFREPTGRPAGLPLLPGSNRIPYPPVLIPSPFLHFLHFLHPEIGWDLVASGDVDARRMIAAEVGEASQISPSGPAIPLSGTDRVIAPAPRAERLLPKEGRLVVAGRSP